VVAPTNSSPAVKALTNLIERDGLLYMQYHGRELLHDGADWGEDNTIPIVDNEGTTVDLNAVTVKTFTHIEIPSRDCNSVGMLHIRVLLINNTLHTYTYPQKET